jgi:hypothetical protein
MWVNGLAVNVPRSMAGCFFFGGSEIDCGGLASLGRAFIIGLGHGAVGGGLRKKAAFSDLKCECRLLTDKQSVARIVRLNVHSLSASQVQRAKIKNQIVSHVRTCSICTL